MSAQRLLPQHQSVLLGLAQGWDAAQIATALGRARSTIYAWITESRAIVEARIPDERKAELALETRTATGLVMAARSIGLVDPDLRLLASGVIAMSPASAARGKQL